MFDVDLLRTLVDGLIVFTGVEMLALQLWHGRTGRGLPWGEFGVNLLSGLFLMGAVRCALTPGAWPALLACLVGAGLCHAFDLSRRIALRRTMSAVRNDR